MAHGDSTSTAVGAAVASATAAAGKKTKTLSPSKIYQNHFVVYHWYIVAGVVGFFAIWQVISLLANRQRRLAIIKARTTSATSEKDDFASKPTPSAGVLSCSRAVKASVWKTIIWREFTVGLWSCSSSELFWSVGYTLAMLVFGFVYNPSGSTPVLQASMYANRCGRLAFAQLPLIIGLASKNNILSWFTGISYEKLNFLHRSAGRACLILSWVHAIGRSVPIKLSAKNSLKHLHMQMGCIALAAFTIMTLLSFKPFLRRMAYEAFLISHIILALLFLIGSYMHWDEYGIWVWPSFLFWGLDRLVRVGKTIMLNKLWLSFSSKTGVEQRTAVVETLHGNALRVTLPRAMSWTPGQHAYLVCPTVSRFPFEAHPFTIASIPTLDKKTNSDVTFIIGANDGFTGRLLELTNASGGRVEIPAYLDGPYGTIHSLDSYSSVVLVAGGSGVTYILPMALQLVRQAQEGSSAVSTLTFVWVVRNVEHIAWISSTLLQLRADCPSSLILDFKIFVTKAGHLTPHSDLPRSASSSTSGEITSSSDEGRSSPDSGSADTHDEKLGKVGGAGADGLEHTAGRPDFGQVLGEVIRDAKGGAVAVNVCGPSSLSSSVRTALNSRDGPYKVKDVWNGGSTVTLHQESFGW